MALYVPPAFAAPEPALAQRIVDEHPFATLLTPADPEPQVTHLPLLREGDVLIGHAARANPHWHSFTQRDSIAIFHGPHAYVSPTWYASSGTMVPTWNYCTVHVHGRIELVEDAAGRERVMAMMVGHFEGQGADAWRFSLAGKTREGMLRAIVAFRMPMSRVTAKLKLSQNRDAGDRARVEAALERSEHAVNRAIARWMHTLGERRDGGR